MSDRENAALGIVASRLSELRGTVDGLVRTRQMERTSVVAGGSDVMVSDLLTDANDVVSDYPATVDSLVGVDIGQSDDLDTIGSGDRLLELVDDAGYETGIAAVENTLRVRKALSDADAAAIDAAFAKETALGNARYQQIDGGPAPTPPAGGFRVGAELTHVDVDGHPYRVEAWNGTAWVLNRLLLDQALFLSPEGTVQIGNATVVSPTIIGGEFYGNTFEGGQFSLSTITAVDSVVYDPCEVVGSWRSAPSPAGVALTRSSTQRKAGTYSIVPGYMGSGATSIKRAYRPIPAGAYTRGGNITVWVYVSVTSMVNLGIDTGVVAKLVTAGVWTELKAEVPEAANLTRVWVEFLGPSGTYSAYVDELRVVSYASLAGRAAVERDNVGRAVVVSEAADASRSALQDGVVVTESPDGSETSFVRHEILYGNVGIHEPSTVHELEDAFRRHRMRSFVSHNGGGFVLQNFNPGGALFAESRVWIDQLGTIQLDGKTVQPGNTFTLKSQLDAWATAPAGTHAWVTATGWEYIRAGGKWVVLSTNGEVDITSSMLAAYRGTMKYSVAGGTLFLNVNAVGDIGAGQTVVGNLASDLRPSGLMAGAARLSSDYAGSFLVNAAGAVVAATRTGLSHTTATGSVTYGMT